MKGMHSKKMYPSLRFCPVFLERSSLNGYLDRHDANSNCIRPRAFLRRICETPFDDTPRLIYGDWLEEIGEVREAEFIREQIVRPSMIISLATDIDEITGERFFEYDQCRGFLNRLNALAPTSWSTRKSYSLSIPSRG